MAEHAAEGGSLSADRRSLERRGRRTGFRLRERRTGFDRRCMAARGRISGAWGSLIHRYRGADWALGGVLVAANVLNSLDLAMTVRALEEGAVEANPVLAILFASGPWAAGVFKISVMLGMSVLVWRMRRFRRVLEMSLVLVGVFCVVAAYQIAGAAWLS